MEYQLIFEDLPNMEEILKIAKENDAIVEESDDSNFGGGEMFVMACTGISALSSLLQIMEKYPFMKNERIIVIRHGETILKNVTLEDAREAILSCEQK